jgi:LacI family transcriptional regulator
VNDETVGTERSAETQTVRSPTIKDVAALAKVDVSTVSRALRNDPRQVMRPETRERIFEAARILRYRPNAVARSLRTRRTNIFALIVPTVDNPGFVDVVLGAQDAANEAGKLMMLAQVPSQDVVEEHPAYEESLSRLVLDGLIDGLIVSFATLDDWLTAHLAAHNIPLVLVNRRAAAVVHGWVGVDDRRGVEIGVQHLLDLGHRRIGFIGLSPQTDTGQRREEGYRAAMGAAGLAIDPRWIATSLPIKRAGSAALQQILERSGDSRPTAIFCSTLLGALGVLSLARDRGLRVPEQLSLVAFNDHSLADDLSPPLTTVRMPNFKMGQEAMRMAIRAADGLVTDDYMIPDPPELMIRGSTEPPAPARED